jgi:hypothetical protein
MKGKCPHDLSYYLKGKPFLKSIHCRVTHFKERINHITAPYIPQNPRTQWIRVRVRANPNPNRLSSRVLKDIRSSYVVDRFFEMCHSAMYTLQEGFPFEVVAQIVRWISLIPDCDNNIYNDSTKRIICSFV